MNKRKKIKLKKKLLTDHLQSPRLQAESKKKKKHNWRKETKKKTK
jgi:hypothetical protein